MGRARNELLARGFTGVNFFKYQNNPSGPGLWTWGISAGPFPDSDPSTTPPTDWTQPQYYSTIQAADIDGDGRAEVLGRSSAGVMAYSWNGSTGKWEYLATATDFCDTPCGFDQATYYSTIQFAHIQGQPINGHPAFQLVARTGNGVRVYEYNASNKTWTLLNPQGGPFPDVDQATNTNWGDVQYYSTIQFADVDGDGKAEALGRGAEGLETWQWTGTGWNQLPTATDLNDGSPGGFNQPQYYSTIQFADIDGKPGAELIARNNAGIIYYFWHGDTIGWGSYADKPSNQHYGPLLANDPWAGGAQYYGTIRLADIDGKPGAELIARGPYGIRTWAYTPASDPTASGTWKIPWDPGFPPFTADQQTAYLALSKKVSDDTGTDTVRDAYGETTTDFDKLASTIADFPVSPNNPDTAACPSTINSCPMNPGVTCQATTVQDPTDPSSTVTISSADWTAVVTELLTEICSVQEVKSYYAWLQGNNHTLFAETSESGTTIAIAAELETLQVDSTDGDVSADFGELFLGILGDLATLAEGPLGLALEVGVETFGSLANGVAGISNPSQNTEPGLFSELIAAQADAALANRAIALDTQADNDQAYILGNGSLLATVGGLILGNLWASDNVTQAAFLERRTPAPEHLGLSNALAGAVSTLCSTEDGADANCDEPIVGCQCQRPIGTYVQYSGRLNYNFSGVAHLGKGTTLISYPFSSPSDNFVRIIRTSIPPTCEFTYSGTLGDGGVTSQWEYGCSLGVPDADVFNNQNGFGTFH